MNHSWERLPTEIYLRIFEQLFIHKYNVVENWGVTEYQLLPCLLVCKSWNKPASVVLYRSVELERQGLKFLNALVNSSASIGHSVKELYIGANFGFDLNDYSPTQVFAEILRHCPLLEHIRLASSVQDLLGPSLIAESQHLRCLKTLYEPADNSTLRNTDWRFLTRTPLYFMDCLTRLNLLGISGDSTTSDQQSLYQLIDQLGQFTGLTHLYIAGSKDLSLRLFDSIIDDCGHLKYLVLWRSQFTTENFEERLIRPNYTVKSITCDSIYFTARNLTYFSKKFQGLQCLKMDRVPVNLQLREADIWDLFVKYLCQLDSYEMSLDVMEFKTWILIYTQQLSLNKRYSPKKRSLLFDFNVIASDIGYRMEDEGLEFTYKDGSEKISLNIIIDDSSSRYEDEVLEILDKVNHIFARYPAKIVQFQDFNNVIGYANTLDPNDSIQDIIKRDSPDYTTLDWNVFDRIRLQNDYIDNINLTISHLILRCEPPTTTTEDTFASNNPVGNLVIEYSIIHEDLFPQISTRYTNLDVLTIYACSIIGSKDPFRMTINLPDTHLNLLVISCSEFISSDEYSICYMEEDVPLHVQRFDNANLRNALSTGRVMVVVETDSMPRCWFIKNKGLDVLIPSNESTFEKFTRTNNDHCFLLTIKCKYLEEFELESTGDEGVIHTYDMNVRPKVRNP